MIRITPMMTMTAWTNRRIRKPIIVVHPHGGTSRYRDGAAPMHGRGRRHVSRSASRSSRSSTL